MICLRLFRFLSYDLDRFLLAIYGTVSVIAFVSIGTSFTFTDPIIKSVANTRVRSIITHVYVSTPFAFTDSHVTPVEIIRARSIITYVDLNASFRFTDSLIKSVEIARAWLIITFADPNSSFRFADSLIKSYVYISISFTFDESGIELVKIFNIRPTDGTVSGDTI